MPKPLPPTLLEDRKAFLRFLTNRLPSKDLAEDILQSAYLKALQQSTTLRDQESSKAWFYRILRNAIIDRHRHSQVEDHALTAWARELETEQPPNDLTHDLVCRCIAKVLPTLNPAYAEILQSVALDESTLPTYAARHNITPANATVRIHRARKALKQRLIETCGTCAIHACLNCSCIA